MELAYPGLGLLCLRLTFGALTFSHGVHKWGSLDKFRGTWGLSRPVAIAVALIQTVGGVLIFMGFLTQIAALANCVVNAGILYKLIRVSDEPFLAPGQHSWSIGVAYLGMAFALALGGGGALAVDHLF
ncbi:MAG: DoxX family membrane protein [Pseudomonadota bacterium]